MTGKKRTAREPLLKCRKRRDDVKTVGESLLRDKLRRNLSTGGAASGMRGGLSLPKRRLNGTWEPETPMLTEKPQVQETRGREYGSGDSGGGTACSSDEVSDKEMERRLCQEDEKSSCCTKDEGRSFGAAL